LKIPSEVSTLRKLKILSGTSSQKELGSQKPETLPAELVNISNVGEEALYTSCPICNLIFEENQSAVKCPICDVFYHIDCFKGLNESQCKNCGTKLQLS
jgi:hypothetical protein